MMEALSSSETWALTRATLHHSPEDEKISNLTYKLLMGKTEGKRGIGRSRCRRLDNIKMDVGEME
jgi:hypothetical protein